MRIRATVVAGMAAGMAVATAGAAFGQSAGTRLRFEVVSIKPVAPRLDGRYMVRMRADPGRLDYSSVSLKAIIQQACEVRDFQISGPEWLASIRFDVAAKLPADTPRSKVPEMLRSLLAERFKMATHRETRELPMYALAVGKNGPKMKESEADPTRLSLTVAGDRAALRITVERRLTVERARRTAAPGAKPRPRPAG